MNNNGGSPPPSPFCCNCGCQSEKSKFPPGYKFNPTDEELVVNYLKNKAMNKPLPHSDIMQNKILEVNLYSHNPEDLAEGYNLGSSSGEEECFFFTPRDRKYRNGNRPNRAAGDGYWKATGVDKAVKSNEVIVGYRRALVFYKGKPPKGDKTSWIMHEYRFNAPARKRMSSNDMRLDDWVLCRIHKKKEPSKPKSKGEEEATESVDVTGEQSVEAAASDENQIHDDDDDQDMTEMDGNIERYTDNDFEQHQYSPLPTYNPYGVNQTSPLPHFQGGSLANTPLYHHAHFPQFYEDEQPPPDQVMVQPAFGKRPSMYPQMGPNSNMMFRRQYATESKPTGLVPRQQQQQQHDDEFEFKASLGQLQACLVDEDMSSDHSKDKSPGTSHDLPFNEEYGA